MLSEHTICEMLSAMLPSGRLNDCFESDAEVITWNGAPSLFTTDEFSAEDLFRETDPYLLGWNIAAGAISDILACGGTPVYYAHALTVDKRWDQEFVRQFGGGVRDVLEATGARFIGGDCGRAEQWRCTVSVIGSCEGRPVLRRGAAPGDSVYLSGPIGAGNLEAALTLLKPTGSKDGSISGASIKTPFPLRQKESALMRKHASACIDTSDGVCAALNTLADLNGCGYAVADLPYLSAGLRLCEQLLLPKTLLFLGEGGEYELLFTVKAENERRLHEETLGAGCVFHRLGSMTASGRTLREDDRVIDLEPLRMQARDYEHPRQYLESLLQRLAAQLGERS